MLHQRLHQFIIIARLIRRQHTVFHPILRMLRQKLLILPHITRVGKRVLKRAELLRKMRLLMGKCIGLIIVEIVKYVRIIQQIQTL